MTKEEFSKFIQEAPKALEQWLISQELDNIEGVAVMGKTIGKLLVLHSIKTGRSVDEVIASFLITLATSAKIESLK